MNEQDEIKITGDVPTPDVVEDMIRQVHETHKRELVMNGLYLFIALLLWAIQIALIATSVITNVIAAAITGACAGLIIAKAATRFFGEIHEYKETMFGLVGLLRYTQMKSTIKEQQENDVFDN